METRSKETEMIGLADRLSVEFSRYFFEHNATTDYGVDVPFYILIFGFVAAIYADVGTIDKREHDLFLARAADYVVVEGLGTRRRNIVITTPEYREKLPIVDKLLKFTNDWVDESLLLDPNEESFWDEVLVYVDMFRRTYNELALRLKAPKIDETRKKFIAEMYGELLKRFYDEELFRQENK
jgi:hypothetical protein